uniref:Cytochrome c peroxidase, mitochondrial n=1 Tax=Lygus hesperus TaxID=30085 RepID=A0A0A9W785_LYGHE
MRFAEESSYGANAGLEVARKRLEIVKKKFPEISYADLWTLASVVAIEYAGGPAIPWRPGRSDASSKQYYIVPDGRLPDGSLGADHIHDTFSRMGFTPQETVALIGAHCMGKCHKDRSGFDGPWTRAPTTFSN